MGGFALLYAVCGLTENTTRKKGAKFLVARKHSNLGVREQGEEPSWGETRWSGPGVATLDRSLAQSPWGESHIPSS